MLRFGTRKEECSIPRRAMTKVSFSLAAVTPVVALMAGLAPDAHAVDLSSDLRLRQLHTNLQTAVCNNDWDAALRAIAPMIAAPTAPNTYQEQLIYFRDQLEGWRAANARFANAPNCGGHIATNPSLRSPVTSATPSSRSTQNVLTQQLHAALQNAVCQNDWDNALRFVAPLIGQTDISSTYRERLVILRHQLEDWRAAGTAFDARSCSSIAGGQGTPSADIRSIPAPPTVSIPVTPAPAEYNRAS